ncbi:uncharacterized protein MONBRDRAFT_18216 [Monosiga brevicollis MX1]|uniref:Saccharopine dehydrogenase NADP binding domain-containing protein n=1 Tax=Monosiga brevicollis TaxID=81824 RepID=A9UV00_MONBE|nr:uncharacterized protein MONBRDRAFT_18216 [Monosiga brevicollis MX1]EDQ91000.1 predicted protein [Monosiga brevicollis MX1]|eukprot:XP_001744297.1 hypothetical protein [Monosiga brevicollis MX1]
MARPYDLVVFGASGFTGQYVVKFLHTDDACQSLRVAIAGRSQSKVQAVNERFGANFDVLVGDVNDAASLEAISSQATILLNCVGPYRFFGEQVVKACVNTGTNYLDISGEPEFIERIEVEYNEQAKAKGITIISACGFDSIPADLGTLFTVSQFPEGSRPASVESYLQLHAGEKGCAVHYATYESAVHGFGSAEELRALRKRMPKVNVPVVGPRGPKSSLPRFDQRVNAYALPFPGSDASIVRRSQRYLAQTESPVSPVQYSAFFTISQLLWTSIFVACGTVFGLLASFEWGRSFLLKYPKVFSMGVFSHEGPTEEQMAETAFSMTFFAQGYSSPDLAQGKNKPDVHVSAIVSGPEPGYVTTPICIVTSALTRKLWIPLLQCQ